MPKSQKAVMAKGQKTLTSFFKPASSKKKPQQTFSADANKEEQQDEDDSKTTLTAVSTSGSSIGNGSETAGESPSPKNKRSTRSPSPNAKKKAKTAVPHEKLEEKKDPESELCDTDDDVEMADSPSKEQKFPNGTTIRKKFGRKWYLGEVTSFRIHDENGPLYHVVYEDDDEEELSEAEVRAHLEKPKKAAASRSKSRSSRGKLAKKAIHSDSESDFEMDDHSDESDDGLEVDNDSETLGSDDAMMDDEDDDDVIDFKPTSRPKKKKEKVSRKADNVTSKEEKPKSKPGSKSREEYEKKLKKDIKDDNKGAMNNPQKLPKSKDFVDPVGVDPTFGIVEGIVAAQVRKIGKLIQMVNEDSQKQSEPRKGELTFPIKLQTACSGTDAPSIALGLVQESLDKMLPKEARGLFQFSHEMSCEIEPFKQGYIGRNFPGVLLFPDINKLSASETVLDVYGRAQKLPDGNLFVAGTSCKDFSMLKGHARKDIEDKGTSGETFLSAVEFLELKQPPVAIFENVDGAPWEKMQEYISGRLSLASRNDKKGITGKLEEADDAVKFSVDENGRYVVEQVPRQVGLRAGNLVQGFVKGGSSFNKVVPLVSEDKSTKQSITLGQMAKTHHINLESDILVMEKKARYCTKLIKLDTKEYGLPQTRNRKYLFIWRSDDAEDDLGDYFEEIMDHLKTPLLYSMDAFLLKDTHDRIRCFREALRSGPGQMVHRDRAREPNFWDWDEAGIKDLTLHQAFRFNRGIEEEMRWITGWQPKGKLNLAPGCWPELFRCWNHRRFDLIDCFAASVFRDAISRDALHHSFTWDLSQNVTRAPVRSANLGVSGCVTPGGELLLPRKGRTMMGFEKLLLQGIPYSRLVMGTETEVQLSDLAGNAMSVPVVCATMLAALCAPQLRRARESEPHAALGSFALSQKYDSAEGSVLAERGDFFEAKRDEDTKMFVDVFKDVAQGLATSAFQSSVLCTSESSGTTSKEAIMQCNKCGWCVSMDCVKDYQTSSHSLVELKGTGIPTMRDPHEFERKLRCTVPSVLRLGQEWEEHLGAEGTGLESYSFQLQEIERMQGKWQLIYGAWEDFGSGRQVAELRVQIGRVFGLLSEEVGFVGFLRCFSTAIRNKKPRRGILPDSCVISYRLDQMEEPRWEFRASPTKCKLKLAGSGNVASQRVQAGISEKAAKALNQHKISKQFEVPIESRNPLTKYRKDWTTWPKDIVVSGDSKDKVNGTYHYAGCKHSVVLSALWIREATDTQPAMYIMYKPDVLRCNLDTAVISLSPRYQDNKEVVELHDWIPENSLETNTKTHATTARFLEWCTYEGLSDVEAPPPCLSMTNLPSFEDALKTSSSGGACNLCEISGLSTGVISSLLELADDSADSTTLDLFGSLGTRNAKRMSIVAAPSLLKFAAEDKLPLVFNKWYQMPKDDYGSNPLFCPERPLEQWRKASRGFERFYDPEHSNQYYHDLMNRPKAFHVKVVRSEGKLIVQMNPTVAAHGAAAQLGGEISDKVDVSYSMAELSCMGEPETKPFIVPNSDAYEETHIDGLELPLYPRQAKALTRMLAIENRAINFPEEERSEYCLPGIGWCLIGKATKLSPLRGGVLGDAIGSGKTVVTIALVLAGAEKARTSRNVEQGRSSATLICVPPALVRQWDDERKKFTKNKLKCIVIDSTAALKRHSVKDLCSADIVIVPASILEESNGKLRPYTAQLSSKAGAGTIPPAPATYSQRECPTIEGKWVRNMAPGPTLYVGNDGKQSKRDEQAYYGHCYSEAIAKLRSKKFSAETKGVPLEYFTWERVVIDECHESLVTGSKQESNAEDFKQKARRGAREFLGVSQTDVKKRPLLAASYWGLTGTPLLETEDRVTELANLMGGTYLTGAAFHWRREERESGRDLFLNQSEAIKSREYRCAVQDACHQYCALACQRNRGQQLNVKMNKKLLEVCMSDEEGQQFLQVAESAGVSTFATNPTQLGDKAGELLGISAVSTSRQKALVDTIGSIGNRDAQTKIIVFANTTFGAYTSAIAALKKSGIRFCHVDEKDSIDRQNEIISWFRHVDATDEDKARPRILLLSFEQAAGHNLQEACHDVIIFEPKYSGADAVADASVEEQAVGRVMRQGQENDVNVYRIVVKGPKGELCLDNWIVERNLDEDTLAAATSNFD